MTNAASPDTPTAQPTRPAQISLCTFGRDGENRLAASHATGQASVGTHTSGARARGRRDSQIQIGVRVGGVQDPPSSADEQRRRWRLQLRHHTG
jgi:hypothetical protein